MLLRSEEQLRSNCEIRRHNPVGDTLHLEAKVTDNGSQLWAPDNAKRRNDLQDELRT